jgi:hypothetical protein
LQNLKREGRRRSQWSLFKQLVHHIVIVTLKYNWDIMLILHNVQEEKFIQWNYNNESIFSKILKFVDAKAPP